MTRVIMGHGEDEYAQQRQGSGDTSRICIETARIEAAAHVTRAEHLYAISHAQFGLRLRRAPLLRIS